MQIKLVVVVVVVGSRTINIESSSFPPPLSERLEQANQIATVANRTE